MCKSLMSQTNFIVLTQVIRKFMNTKMCHKSSRNKEFDF